MTRPRLLDLFCGAGGAAMGYHRAGFEVVGVDIKPQPRYPFRFIQADAMTFPLDGFDAIHASPPCQAYSVSTKAFRNRGKVYPDLLGPVRDLLLAQPQQWIIENVPGAPMRPDLKLCGCEFGLTSCRQRWFELSWSCFDLRPGHNGQEVIVLAGGSGTTTNNRKRRERLGLPIPTLADKKAALGIDWMTREQLFQAIPPAFTEFIGRHLLEAIERAA